MKKAIVVCISLFLLTIGISAQSTHSSLKDPVLLKRFQSISHSVMCTCGCYLPLYYCNHVGHCNAWPMRSAVDQLLTEGHSEDFIINGFINGFGDMIDTDPAFKMMRDADYNYLVPKFKVGLGEEGLTQPRGSSILIYLALGALLIIGFAVLFIKRHFSKLKPVAKAEPVDAETERKLMEKVMHNP